jgi:hypothetical protein
MMENEKEINDERLAEQMSDAVLLDSRRYDSNLREE